MAVQDRLKIYKRRELKQHVFPSIVAAKFFSHQDGCTRPFKGIQTQEIKTRRFPAIVAAKFFSHYDGCTRPFKDVEPQDKI